MLRPQNNAHRIAVDLSGLWDFRMETDTDRAREWQAGVPDTVPLAVPGSWNEQYPHLRDDIGVAWYQTRFAVPHEWEGRTIGLRFGSVNYAAEVWVNGQPVGGHVGGHLPFWLDATKAARTGTNVLVVRVDARLQPDRVPPGTASTAPAAGDAGVGGLGATGEEGDDGGGMNSLLEMLSLFRSEPQMHCDFFPYSGIQRAVHLTCTHPDGLTEIAVLETNPDSGAVRVRVRATATGTKAVASIGDTRVEAPVVDGAELTLSVPDPQPWGPGHPHLYELRVALERDGVEFDSYVERIGLRTVAVDGERLLLNGEPVMLRGFGRHEDFPVLGRAFSPAVAVRDFAAMQWIGANSFRTSHYPYAEEQLDLADELGFLVISETPAVGLGFGDDHEQARLDQCIQHTEELIRRDRNHACVVMWSLANEPMSFDIGRAQPFFEKLVEVARTGDDARPLTIVNPLANGPALFELCDVICLNRYPGWYTSQGRIAEGVAVLAKELDELQQRFGKPIIITEFGGEGIAGHHAEPPEMFSEEYQAALIKAVLDAVATRPYVVGQHVWNMCDFKTGQSLIRPGSLNQKGVFTRTRQPKQAAHLLRSLWSTMQP